MHTYLALLRGVNVGGNAMLKMADLRAALSDAGFAGVRTYIHSGNVILESNQTDTNKLSVMVAGIIKKQFNLDVGVGVFSKAEWQRIIAAAPKWWGDNPEWKHNLLIMLKPFEMKDIVAAYGELKPAIEAMQPGEGVLYQSMSYKLFGRTTSGKLASNPIYKQMTIRNFNTAQKLAQLLD